MPDKRMIQLAVFASHPVQYQVPWFLQLARETRLRLMVYYSMIPTPGQQGIGFDVPFSWDIPLLEGYEWRVLANRRKNPDLSGFFSTSNPAVGSVLTENRPDVVILSGWHRLPLLQALWASVKLRIPRIVRGESNSIAKRAKWKKLFHSLHLSSYDAFLSIGKKNREFYIRHGISTSRIFDAPYFVDNARFESEYQKNYQDRSEIRKGWKIPETSFCYLFVGKIEPKKRLLDLLKAIDIVRKVRPETHLLVVGTGQLLQEAQLYALTRGLPVTFAGFLNQSEITKAYVAADCLVLPSNAGETWGLVVNEAMACGIPAIVSDQVGCGSDLIEDGVTGKIFPLGNVPALAEILTQLSSSREENLQMGRNAKNKVQEYSVEKTVEGTLRAIDFVLKNPHPADQYPCESDSLSLIQNLRR
jgi:glycosyltransferase involved in cell wall biosynthesis